MRRNFTIMSLSRTLAKVYRAYAKYTAAVQQMDIAMTDKALFECKLEFQPSDGFVFLDVETARVAPAAECIGVIHRKGYLSREDFNTLCI